MKLLVLVSLCICISQTAAVSTEIKTKMAPKGNAIPAPQKTELYFPQANQATQTEFMPVHVMQKPLFVQHAQPQPAMVIIAQPAYVPQNVIYGNPGGMQQQLLNYFHSNPQAKYQLLFGGYQPHPTAQSYIPQHPLTASTVPAYQIVPSPVFNGFNHLVSAPSQVSFSQAQPFHQNQIAAQPLQLHQTQIAAQPFHQNQIAAQPFHQTQIAAQPYHQNQMGAQYVQPMQLNQIAQLAQMQAQQVSAPIRSFPPIITGFENFTPEQQVQIKAQLGAHLGAPLTTATTAPATTSQYTSPVSTQPTQSLNTNDYMQSQDKNVPQSSGSSYSPSLVYRGQYTKG